jgi:FAD/FMN-containing dehydrogenase
MIQKNFSFIPKERFLLDKVKIGEKYGTNTLSKDSEILAVLMPLNVEEVCLIVKTANQCKTPIYPLSTGNNWGYGCSLPASSGCIIIDLGKMDAVIDFDSSSGVVTIQPGVTQLMLHQYLSDNDYDYMVPTTGAGPSCSLLGNLLERGFGLAPISDHIQSLTSIEAVLGDGSIYQSDFPNDSKAIEKKSLWNIGPLISMLFSQSNFGVITQASIRLVPRQEKIGLFIFGSDEQEVSADFCAAVNSIQNEVGATHMSPITLMHGDRFARFSGSTEHGLTVVDKLVGRFLSRKKWVSFFAVYGNSYFEKAVLKTVGKRLAAYNPFYFSEKSKNRLLKVLQAVNYLNSFGLRSIFGFLDTALTAFSGVPTDKGLSIVYGNNGNLTGAKVKNPSLDGCGVIWFSPLLATDDMMHYFRFAEGILNRHKRSVFISFTTVSPGLVFASVPLLYDKSSEVERRLAHECYSTLLEKSITNGYHPYRLGVLSMPDKLPFVNGSHWETVLKIKQALDPNGIVSPGRYCLTSVPAEKTAAQTAAMDNC